MNALSHITVPNCCGVYRLTHAASGLFYVGGSTQVRRRLSEHFREMRTGRKAKSKDMCALYAQDGAMGWTVAMLEVCEPAHLKVREQFHIDALHPPLNLSPVSHAPMRKGTKLDEAGCAERSRRTKALWADPQYRERAVAARAGKAYNAGYKCTPEQIENRRRAALKWHADARSSA